MKKPVSEKLEESVTIYEWPAGKPLPPNYRDGAWDLLSDEDVKELKKIRDGS